MWIKIPTTTFIRRSLSILLQDAILLGDINAHTGIQQVSTHDIIEDEIQLLELDLRDYLIGAPLIVLVQLWPM